jgi:hypothetical protein
MAGGARAEFRCSRLGRVHPHRTPARLEIRPSSRLNLCFRQIVVPGDTAGGTTQRATAVLSETASLPTAIAG